MPTAPPPAYPTWPPPPYPPATPPVRRRRRRWPAIAAAAAAGAIITATIATIVTTATNTPPPTAAPPAPETITVTPGPPPAPKALPAKQADQQTCRTWEAASMLVTAAALAQGVIPPGTTITDPAVQNNPGWKAGALKAGKLYGQAADTIKITPGTTQTLANNADTAISALRTLDIAYTTFDPANGYAMTTFQSTQATMNVICR